MRNLLKLHENLVICPLKFSQDFHGFWFHSDCPKQLYHISRKDRSVHSIGQLRCWYLRSNRFYLIFQDSSWVFLMQAVVNRPSIDQEPKPIRKMLIVYVFTFGLHVRLREKTFHHFKCSFRLHCFLWAPIHADVPYRRCTVRCHLSPCH